MSPPTFSDHLLARLLLLAFVAVVVAFSLGAGDAVRAALGVVRCPFRLMTSLPCPGCGMTRACLALAQGDFVAAWLFHPFSIPLVAMVALYGCWPQWVQEKWSRVPKSLSAGIVGSMLALLIGRWILLLIW